MIGIDEAGRGPVLGPLVVAAVKVGDEGQLEEIGVRDSKKLTPKRRERLLQGIAACSEFALASASAVEIDALRRDVNLNEIERMLFSRAAESVGCGGATVFVDCCDTDEDRMAADLRSRISCADVVSRHKADERFPCVAAASIVAKVHRDRCVSLLNDMALEAWGVEIGSGYPSDPKTCRFLEFAHNLEGGLPFFVRRSWKTVRRPSQSTLDAYDE